MSLAAGDILPSKAVIFCLTVCGHSCGFQGKFILERYGHLQVAFTDDKISSKLQRVYPRRRLIY